MAGRPPAERPGKWKLQLHNLPANFTNQKTERQMKRIQAETGVKNSELLAKPDLEDHIVMKMFISMGVEIGKAGHIEVEKTITGPQTQYKVEFYVCTHAELQKIINLVRQIQRRPIPRLINQKADEIYDLITR